MSDQQIDTLKRLLHEARRDKAVTDAAIERWRESLETVQAERDAAADEIERLTAERDALQASLAHHFTGRDDPCQDRGVEWPCDVAEAFGYGSDD